MGSITHSAERVAISFFGKRNAGKSSLLNAITNQEIAVVSDKKGTTTDPVSKAMELLPLGAVTLTDTPGFDDFGELGEKRVKKTEEILRKTDIAVIVIDSLEGRGSEEEEFMGQLLEKNIPYITVYTKADLLEKKSPLKEGELYVSARDKTGISSLKAMLAAFAPKPKEIRLVGDFIKRGGTVILVCPIDASAPKGRLILPQQQAIRDILDSGAMSLVCQPGELQGAMESLTKKPDLVICDSQVFKSVSQIVPEDVPLTSFSILFARYKGMLDIALKGANALDTLSEGDRVLIAEGCTHHRQCGDIGTEKLPKWISEYTKKNLRFEFSSGGFFPDNSEDFKLIIHCGGCMLSDREILYRQQTADLKNVPITNFGLAIAKINGILERATSPLSKLK